MLIKLQEFFSDWTGKDWSFLALTIVGIFVGLAAIFNWWGKLKDWWAKQDEKRFHERLHEHQDLLHRHVAYDEQPGRFFAELIRRALLYLMFLLVFGLVTHFTSSEIGSVPILKDIPVELFFFLALSFTFRLYKEAHYFCDPESLFDDSLELVKLGRDKGWITQDVWEQFDSGVKAALEENPGQKSTKKKK